MKSLKILILSMLLLAFTASTYAQNTSESVTVKRFVKRERMVLIERRGEENPWLINYEGRCNFTEEEKAILSLYNDLDSYGDKIEGEKCAILRAEPVNMELRVQSVLPSGTVAYVRDEQGQLYRMRVDGNQCPLRRYKNDVLYGWRYEAGKVDEYDDIFLPYNADITCNMHSLTKVVSTRKADSDDSNFADESSPSQVTDVKVVPGNKQVWLRWAAASDNVGVDHYLISYSAYHLNPDGPDLSYMPKQIETKETSYTIKGLENNEEYFFYVLAVDATGNTSSRWSREVSTTTSSDFRNLDALSAVVVKSDPAQNQPLKIQLSSQAWFLRFSWNKSERAIRQTVTLKQKGEDYNMWIKYHWNQNQIVVPKNILEKGKVYQLTVKSYSQSALLGEQTKEFGI